MAKKEKKVEKVLNGFKISEYEKTIKDIDFEHKKYETLWEMYSTRDSLLLSSKESSYRKRRDTLASSIKMLELLGVDCTKERKILGRLDDFSILDSEIGNVLGIDYINRPFIERIDLYASKINADSDLLTADALYNMFAFCTKLEKKYNDMGNAVKSKVDIYKRTMPIHAAYLRALREENYSLDISEMVTIIRAESVKTDVEFSIRAEMLNDDLKQAEFFTQEADILRYEFVKKIKKEITKRNGNYLSPIQKFNEYVDVKYPSLATLDFDKKVEGLLTIYGERGSVPEEDGVACLLFSSMTSPKYKKILSDLSGYVNLYKEDPDKIIEALKARNNKVSFTEMLQSLADYNDFFTKPFKKTDLSYFEQLKEMEVIKREDYIDYVDDILDGLLPRSFALVKYAIEKRKNITPYDVQLMGALALNEGNAAQMNTGEGKTLTALFAAFLNSLTGEEVDVFTPNDYLAGRDAQNAREILGVLGTSIGCTLAADQNVKQKRLAYRSNIVYGSTSAFAFDLLKDTYAARNDNTVQREKSPFYVVVDEADVIFRNEAQTPFKLESSKRVTAQEKKENEEIIEYLQTAFDYSNRLMGNAYANPDLTEISDDFLRRAMGGDFTVKFGLKYGTEDELKEYNRIQENYYVIMGKTDAALTYLGNIALFNWYLHDEIQELNRQGADYFRYGNDGYVEGVDYEMVDGELTLTPKGLLRAVDYIKEYSDLEKKWLTDPRCNTLRSYVNTQLRAFAMEKGANDNGYDVIFNPETGRDEIVILEAGRIQKYSKYERGLHQALELKEFGEIRLDQVRKLMDSSSDSITMSHLLYRYNKISGMTGTPDKELFRNVYMMDTINIPRNAEYQYRKGTSTKRPKKVVEHPCVLYKDEETKLYAIAENVYDSWISGQPVLVVTDNNDEARRLHEILDDSYSMEANLLISGKEDEEADIIANAGRIGSVTIASEMAGRGTDIRLTSSEEDARYVAEDIIDTSVCVILTYIEYKKDNPDVSFDSFKEMVTNDLEDLDELMDKYDIDVDDALDSDPELSRMYDTSVETLITKLVSKHQELGMKLIIAKPPQTISNQVQIEGRVGRQGDPGEIQTFTCLDDLNDIGISDEDRAFLTALLDDGDCVQDDEVLDSISSIIEKAQTNIELEQDRVIASSNGVDFAIQSISKCFLDTRKKLLKKKDVSYAFDDLINSAINTMIKDNLPNHKKKKFDKDKKVGLRKLDIDGLIKEVHDVFGISISKQIIRRECFTAQDARDYIKEIVSEKVETLKDQNFELFNSNIKSILFEGLNKTYDEFMYSAESVREQEFSDRLAQNNKHNRENDVTDIYKEALRNFRFGVIGEVFKPNLRRKGTPTSMSQDDIIIEDRDESLSSLGDLSSSARKR